MKTTIELQGFEIVIEESEDGVSVSALKEGEVVEEFTLESEEGEGAEDDVKGFEDFGDEEADFDDEDMPDDESDEDMPEEDEDAPADDAQLESFQSFLNKSKTKTKVKKK